jgi:hypothetical protein
MQRQGTAAETLEDGEQHVLGARLLFDCCSNAERKQSVDARSYTAVGKLFLKMLANEMGRSVVSSQTALNQEQE